METDYAFRKSNVMRRNNLENLKQELIAQVDDIRESWMFRLFGVGGWRLQVLNTTIILCEKELMKMDMCAMSERIVKAEEDIIKLKYK